MPDVVAQVGDEKITRAGLIAELSRAGTARVEDDAARVELARRLVDRMAQQLLLVQAAEAAGVQVDDHEVQRLLRTSAEGYPAGMFSRVLHAEQLTLAQYEARIRKKALVDKYLKERLGELPEASEDEIRARWEQSSPERPPAVHARQLLVKTEEEAKTLLAEIEKGGLTLAAAARRHSVAPEREEGGDLGWFSRGEMPPVFDVCFDLEPGKTSDVIPSEYGFHLFQVVDKRKGGKEPLEHARRRIESEIRRERQEEALTELVADLRNKANIEVDETALKTAVAQLPEASDVTERGPDGQPDDEEVGAQAGLDHAHSGVIENLPKAKELPEKYKKWRDKRRAERKSQAATSTDDVEEPAAEAAAPAAAAAEAAAAEAAAPEAAAPEAAPEAEGASE